MKTRTATQMRIDRLYHYQRFNREWLTRILCEGQIYLSNPNNFNDPWDCRPCFNEAGLDDPEFYERQVQWFDRIGREHTPQLPEEEHERRVAKMRSDRAFLRDLIAQFSSEFPRSIQEQYRVYCLTTDPTHTLMWSHYADNHQGVCLEFACDNDVFCEALKIEYCDEYPLLDLADSNLDTVLLPLTTKSTFGVTRTNTGSLHKKKPLPIAATRC